MQDALSAMMAEVLAVANRAKASGDGAAAAIHALRAGQCGVPVEDGSTSARLTVAQAAGEQIQGLSASASAYVG